MSNRRKPLELKLDSPRVPSGKFIRGVNAFFGIIKDVTTEVCGDSDAVPWVVEVEPGCAVIRAVPVIEEEDDIRPETIRSAITNGLELLEGGTADAPEYFTEKTLKKVRDLSRLNEPEGLRVYVSADSERHEVSSQSAANIEEMLKWTVEDFGTIEGRLLVLAKTRGFEIKIKEEISGRLVTCHIPGNLLDDAKDAFTRRVSVTGTIKYRRDGTPVSIEVDSEDGFFRFPYERELPSIEEIVGIWGRN